MKTIHSLFMAFTLAALAVPASADDAHHAKPAAVTPASADATAMSDAEIRKVDKDQGKVTLRHGEIANLGMPPMTMVFAVKDKAMLDAVKAGDKVKFRAIDDNGRYTVVEMVPAP